MADPSQCELDRAEKKVRAEYKSTLQKIAAVDAAEATKAEAIARVKYHAGNLASLTARFGSTRR